MTNAELSAHERDLALRYARRALESHLGGGGPVEVKTDSPGLCARRASFVTLRRRGSGDLRGCRGEVQPRRKLIESVMRMAVAAATDDPRFEAVTADELESIHIEISALTLPAPIRPADIELGRHGLMVTTGTRAGLLLPDVPVDHGWGRHEFLTHVCRKAGLPDDAWRRPNATLEGFETEVWHEAY
ncbi:MAG TPA: AmmeMemoRadiSam system protein A [Gemmatimonadales bacterium]